MSEMKRVFTLVLCALPCSYTVANENIFIIGTGMNIAPVYEGSKKYQVEPSLEASYAYATDN